MSDDDLTAAYLKELLEREDMDIPVEAVEMERERLLHHLDVVEAVEELTDVDPDELDYVQKQKRRGRAESTNKGVEEDDITRLASIKGVTRDGDRIEMAEWNKYEKIKDLFREDPKVSDFTNDVCQLILFSSNVPPTGRGKSSSMYTFGEIGQTVIPGLRIVSNEKTDEFETLPEKWSEIEELVKSHDGPMLLLLDEIAQFLQYADMGAGKSVAQFLKLLRHNNAHLIGVAHTGADIPKDIRRQVFVVDKIDQKTGVLGYGIEPQGKGDLMQVAVQKLRMTDIPHTNVDYAEEGAETIEIQFDDDDDGEDENNVPTSNCKGVKKNGDDCSQSFGLCDHGYCSVHASSQCPTCSDSDGE